MSRVRVVAAVALVMSLALAAGAGWLVYRRVAGLDRRDRETPEQIRQQIVALDAERTALRERLETLLVRDPRTDGMPEAPVRVGVPTSLARTLIGRVVDGLAGRVTLVLRDIRVRRTGTVRRVVTLGNYDLTATVTRVRATLTPGAPRLTFGGNRVGVAVPVTVGGTARATVEFTWDGRNVAGAVCGDMHVTQEVTGTIVRRTYPVSGAVHLSASATEILALPRLPRLRLHVDVMPSAESWAAMQRILDEKKGLCGFVLDRVDVPGVVKRLIDRGFDVRVPTERVKALALPVGVEPTLMVRGQPVALDIRVGGLAITERMIWLGAEVALATSPPAGAPTAGIHPPGMTPGSSAR